MTDEQLVQQFQYGEQDRFDDLVRRYQDRVLNTCYRYLGDKENARDAAQEVFIKIFYALDSFKPKARVSTWIYRICFNHCLNVIRARKRRRWLFFSQQLEDTGAVILMQDEGNNPEQQIQDSERAKVVQRALSKLSSSQQTAVILHRYQELSYKEIADVMNTSVNAVESLLHRAKKKLAILLKETQDF